MLEFPISSKMLRYIFEQSALINSPQYQEQIKYLNSSEYREMMRYWNSPAVQEEIRLLNSPAVREMITIANNLEIQAKTNSNISIPVREDTLTSLHEATPLIPKESREKFNEITTVEPEASRKLLSAQNIEWAVKTLVAAILSAFLSAFFTFLFQQLPDKNTEEQMELLREPSEIREKIVESLDIDSEELFKDIVKYLDDNGLVIAGTP